MARIHIVEGIGSAAVRTDVQLVQIDRLSVYAQSGDLVTVVRRDVEDLIFAGIHFDRAKRINISIAASRRRDGKGLRCGLCQDDEGAQVVHADADHPALSETRHVPVRISWLPLSLITSTLYSLLRVKLLSTGMVRVRS